MCRCQLGLFVFIVLAVVLFGSSSNLAAAYGIAVTLDMTDHHRDDLLRDPLRLEVPAAAVHRGHRVLLPDDVTFFASNMLKLLAGGWFPLRHRHRHVHADADLEQGRTLVCDRLRDDAIELKGFLDAVFINPPTRVPGTAVFLAAEQGLTPNALMHNLKHNKVLHEHNLFVTVSSTRCRGSASTSGRDRSRWGTTAGR